MFFQTKDIHKKSVKISVSSRLQSMASYHNASMALLSLLKLLQCSNYIDFLTKLKNFSSYAANLLIKLCLLLGTAAQNLISFQLLSSFSTSL